MVRRLRADSTARSLPRKSSRRKKAPGLVCSTKWRAAPAVESRVDVLMRVNTNDFLALSKEVPARFRKVDMP